MQDFTTYNYNITIDQLKDALQVVNKEITVIINGEYYHLIDDVPQGVNITHHLQTNR